MVELNNLGNNFIQLVQNENGDFILSIDQEAEPGLYSCEVILTAETEVKSTQETYRINFII